MYIFVQILDTKVFKNIFSFKYESSYFSMQLIVETEKCNISMKLVSSEDVHEVLAHIGTCLRRIFPGVSPV